MMMTDSRHSRKTIKKIWTAKTLAILPTESREHEGIGEGKRVEYEKEFCGLQKALRVIKSIRRLASPLIPEGLKRKMIGIR